MEGGVREWKRVEESGKEWNIGKVLKKMKESGGERMGGGGMEREEDRRKRERKMQNHQNTVSFWSSSFLQQENYILLTKPNYVICEENQVILK